MGNPLKGIVSRPVRERLREQAYQNASRRPKKKTAQFIPGHRRK